MRLLLFLHLGPRIAQPDDAVYDEAFRRRVLVDDEVALTEELEFVAGMLIADLALGRKNPLIDDFLVEGTANYIPPRPLRDVGVGLTLAWDMWRGRAEQ